MPLVRKRMQRLRQQPEAARLNCRLAGSRAEQRSLDAHDVAEVDQLGPTLEQLFADDVLTNGDLDPAGPVEKVSEAELAHESRGDDPAGDRRGYRLGAGLGLLIFERS